jgi:hypothetical protein
VTDDSGQRTHKQTSIRRPLSVVRYPKKEGDSMMKSCASTVRDLVAALAIAASFVTSAAAQDKVRVGVFPVSSTLPYFVAAERGFFKDQNI